jgi:hypothetical protein
MRFTLNPEGRVKDPIDKLQITNKLQTKEIPSDSTLWTLSIGNWSLLAICGLVLGI